MSDEGNRTVEGQPTTGRVTEFVRVGDTVRRPATANTESMRQLLVHLERCGFGGAPRVVGSEPDGALVLTWIHGWVPTDNEGWRLDSGALESVGELLRTFHDCAQGFIPEAGFEEGPQAVVEGHIVCYGDIAPRNTVFRDGRAVAFIDWDGIFVSKPMWDLGHAVWQFVPVCDDGDPLVRDWPAPRTGRSASRRWFAATGCIRPKPTNWRTWSWRLSPAVTAARPARRQLGFRHSCGCETKACWTT